MKNIQFALYFCIFCFFGQLISAHCQIPCGIYDDRHRIAGLMEDAATIEKAIDQLWALDDSKGVVAEQQRVRWVMAKENHAEKIIETIAEYFLTQRVKPESEDYTERLKAHHAVIILSMKVKQNPSPEIARLLKAAIEELGAFYP